VTLWFVVPAHGRLNLARVCLRQLRRTCDVLTDGGIEASAVVIASDQNLDLADELGFATVREENGALGRRLNHGYQAACDERYNPRAVAYVVPIGSDDWVDPELILSAPLSQDHLTCFRRCAFVREDGRRIARLSIGYPGGVGIRVIPRSFIERAQFRPADEHKRRALDTSTLNGLRRWNHGRTPEIVYHDLHHLQVVDFKSPAGQLNSYKACLRFTHARESENVWGELAEHYPDEAVEEMRAVYAKTPAPKIRNQLRGKVPA
jgi:hypothetical protein